MRTTIIILLVFIYGCNGKVKPGVEYYELSSGLGWEAKIKPEQLEKYVTWREAIDILLNNPGDVEAVGQGHSLQVNVVFKNNDYIQTIEPDIDTIFMVLKKCGKPCAHIQEITE